MMPSSLRTDTLTLYPHYMWYVGQLHRRLGAILTQEKQEVCTFGGSGKAR